MNNPYDIKQLLLEKQSRETKIDLYKGEFPFPQQEEFCKDTSRRKVALMATRCAKSYSIGLMLCECGLNNPGCTMNYVTMTLSTAKQIMIRDIINPINEKFNLGLNYVASSPPRVEFPNGSVIYLFGVDSKENQKNKLLGQKNKLICIDEAQDITIDLEDLIERVLHWRLLETQGQLIMTGTPSNTTNTYFYKVTKDYQDAFGWKYFSWKQTDNPYAREPAIKDLEANLKKNPNYKETDTYQQMGLGRWVIKKNALIYKPNEMNFNVTELPPGEYIYLLGVDLGVVDQDAFISGAYSLKDKHLYVIEAVVQGGNDVTDTAQSIQNLMKKRNYNRIIVDGSNLKAVEEMRRRFGISLFSSDKGKKKDYIRLFNMDLDLGMIKIFPQAAKVLLNEWNHLIWDPKKPGKEKEGLANHASDACLYMWRSAYNWTFKEEPKQELTADQQYEKEFNEYLKKNSKTSFQQMEDQMSFENLRDDDDFR